MKTKVIPHRARKALPEHPAHEQAEPIDLDRLPQLKKMREFIENFLGRQLPTALECEDVIENSYRSAACILDCLDYAADGRHDAGEPVETFDHSAIVSVELELEKMLLASRRLCEVHARATQNAEAVIDRE